MQRVTTKSLKSEYQKWLWMVATVDVLGLLLLVAGMPTRGSLTELVNWQLLTTVVIPVVVLLLVNVLPHKAKCVLVYWRRWGWLPGTEVFTKYGPVDPRVDMQALRRSVGPLPTDPNEQNALWYRLFKQIEDQPEITEAHRNFLMYRDMAALSFLSIPLAPLIFYIAGALPLARWLGAALFAAQYLLTALSGRHNGVRFVTNVLAVHSARPMLTSVVQVP